MSHRYATVQREGYTVPLIGIPESAVLDVCDCCHMICPVRDLGTERCRIILLLVAERTERATTMAKHQHKLKRFKKLLRKLRKETEWLEAESKRLFRLREFME